MGKSWKTAGKVEAAQKKGAAFTKVAREVAVSVKLGGADPEGNARLRMALAQAKKLSVPKDTIDRAIKKGLGQLDDGAQIEELTYEGFGPHGVGVIIECQTDNKHRTAPEIRSLFKSHEGNLGELGSVNWMFQKVAHVEGTKSGNFDPDEEAIEAGANESYKSGDGKYGFYGNPEDLAQIVKVLTDRGWHVETAELSMKPSQLTELTEAQKKDVVEFLNEVDDHDDVHRVHVTLAD